jgi:multidrug efflux pump subunit AcrA (membrane-fusion protein)
MFEPYRLEIIGQLIGMAAIYGLVGRPLWQVCKFFHVPGRIYQVKRPRMYATLAALGTALAGVLLIPLPSAVYCGLEIKPRDATAVYVDMPGRLSEVLVEPRDSVRAGQPLARLVNLDVQMEIEQLTGQRDSYQTQLNSLHQQRFRNKQAGLEIAQVRESLETVADQLKQKQRDQQRLTIAAPVAGTILPPPVTPKQGTEQGELASWSGTPLESHNLGASLAGSTLFCQVGNPQKLEAILVIDQADIERVRQNQSVTIMLDQLTSRTYRSTITEVARTDLKVTSSRLSNKSGGEIATKTDASGRERPLSASYQARVPLDDPEGLLRLGLCGQAKIHAHWETLGARAWRYLARTFSFEL